MTLTENADAENDADAVWDEYHARFGQEPGLTAEELVAAFRQNAEDGTAGHWLTLEEVDAAIRAPRVGRAASGRQQGRLTEAGRRTV